MKVIQIADNTVFKAGKIQLFSDFDRTYCPVRHSALNKENSKPVMKKYCDKMENFFNSAEKDLTFHITTGRTFGEFETVFRLIRENHFKLPLPKSFIAKNGSDEYIKTGSDSDFYSKGIFPFKYNKTNTTKEAEIEKLTNWQGKDFCDFIKNLSTKYGMRTVIADTQHSVHHYGDKSLFYTGNLNPDEWKKLPYNKGKILPHEKPISELTLGIRKDGNLKIKLLLPPDFNLCTEREDLYNNFINEIKEFLNNKNCKYDLKIKKQDEKTHFYTYINISPEINDKALSKLYDTKEALKEAIKNNDMVITAGDGSNDFDMINPLEYIEKSDWEKYKKLSDNKTFFEQDMQKKLYDLKDALNGKNELLKNNLETCGFIKHIKDLPLYSIVIKKPDSKLAVLYDTFKSLGKIIEIENGELDSGIKKAIKNHALEYNTFKEAMSDNLKKLIFENTVKNNKILKLSKIIGVTAFILLSLSGFIYFRNNKQEIR